MRSELCGLLRGARRKLDDGADVVSEFRMMHQLREIAAVLDECVKNTLVQFLAARRRQSTLDGEASQLMSEGDALIADAQQAACDAFVGSLTYLPQQQLRQPQVGSAR